ncbi:MAG: hypothetical protein H6555_11290 [Lewinellaceae bacterium]|nr:hypothetical protein [Lewinellaceae bacterium]
MTIVIDILPKNGEHFGKLVMMEKSKKILFWVPRIMAILAILFVSVFALDAFQPGATLTQQLTDFFIHLIPSFVLLAVLLLAWKRELAGGIIFALIGLVTSPIVFMLNYRMNHSIGMSLSIILLITIPFLVIGVLFIWGHIGKRKPI